MAMIASRRPRFPLDPRLELVPTDLVTAGELGWFDDSTSRHCPRHCLQECPELSDFLWVENPNRLTSKDKIALRVDR